jgi:ribosomal protein L37AE/L43A
MSPIAPQITCPACDSLRVVQVTPIEFGVLECQECRHRWQEEQFDHHDRAPHKRVKRMKETT